MDKEKLRMRLAGGAEVKLVDSEKKVFRISNALGTTIYYQPSPDLPGAWDDKKKESYRPVCLTIYLSNACHMGCSYCYSAENPGRELPLAITPLIDPDCVNDAAMVVAKNCREVGKETFQVVYHGGGEPTLHWSLFLEIHKRLKRLSYAHGLKLQSYLATSGVFSEDKAKWIGQNIDQIGISVDGGKELHDQQRPLKNGRPSFDLVDQTVRILIEQNAMVTVRATITPSNVRYQAAIVEELNRKWGIDQFVFEPAYRDRGDGSSFGENPESESEEFAGHFIAAQVVASTLGCQLETSGIRPDEIHGPFCNVAKQVLQIVPDGTAVTCFVCTDSASPEFAHARLGHWNSEERIFEIDDSAAKIARDAAWLIPEYCEACPNQFHCARDCPDLCPTSESVARSQGGGFRCLTNQHLIERWLLSSLSNHSIESPVREDDRLSNFRDFATDLSRLPGPNAASVAELVYSSDRRGWDPRVAPEPPWKEHGFHKHGKEASDEVLEAALQSNSDRGMAIYIHFPFCSRTCGFCDCHSMVNEVDNIRSRDKYIDALVKEIESWASISKLTERNISTIHLGGGTPTMMSPDQIDVVISTIRERFNVPATCELAFETTSSEIDKTTLEEWREIGFDRIHVGVQTLDDDIRKTIGRREKSNRLIRKLKDALTLGFVTSVDLVIGLPGQNDSKEFFNSIDRLDDLGIHGFSIYKFNQSSRNRIFVETHREQLDSGLDCFSRFAVAEDILLNRGYRKTHFAHYSKPEDEYLYYTHPLRGEDLLALGTTSDGNFGDTYYRNSPLSTYYESAIQGCYRADGYEQFLATSIQPHLMTAFLPAETLELANASLKRKIEGWIEEKLLVPQSGKGWALSATGSWFLSEMLGELESGQ